MPISKAYTSARSSIIPNAILSIITWINRAIVNTAAALVDISVLPYTSTSLFSLLLTLTSTSLVLVASCDSYSTEGFWFFTSKLRSWFSSFSGKMECMMPSMINNNNYEAPITMPASGTICQASSHSSFSWASPSYVSGIVWVSATPKNTPPPTIKHMLWAWDEI